MDGYQCAPLLMFRSYQCYWPDDVVVVNQICGWGQESFVLSSFALIGI